MSKFINNGEPTSIWRGIRSGYFVRLCAQATELEAQAMSYVASQMLAGEVTEEEFHAAERAMHAVERRLCAEWERDHGEPVLNRCGRIIGGEHPALRPDLYEEALRNRARQR